MYVIDHVNISTVNMMSYRCSVRTNPVCRTAVKILSHKELRRKRFGENYLEYLRISLIYGFYLVTTDKQESPAVADKPARRLRKVCTVYVRAVGL